MRNLRPSMLLALLFAFAISVYGTTCAEPTVENVIYWARDDTHNALVKGFLWGLMAAVLSLNIGWFIARTKRWGIAAVLAILTLPFVFAFWVAEMFASPCDFGGLNAYYYVVPLAILILIWLGQVYWTLNSKAVPSIFQDN